MTIWRQLTMQDVMSEFHDGPHATPPPAAAGPVFLGIRNITEGGRLDLSDIRFIAEDDYARWTRRVTPQPDDVVFTYEATLHRYALIPEGFRGCLGRRLALVRSNRSVVLPRFLHFLFLSPDWRTTVTERVISGSTVDRIPLIDFPAFPIRIPDIEYQRRVIEFLGAIDDLIENNRRRIELLEQMAQAIYREWFVHFRYPGHENDKLVDSPLGPIPRDWQAKVIGDVAAYVARGLAPKYAENGESLVVNQKCVRGGRVDLRLARPQSKTIPPEKKLRFGDVLINSTGVGTLGRVAQVYFEPDETTVDTHVTIVRPGPSVMPDYFGLTLLGLAADFEAMGVGSTGQTELGRQRIAEQPVLEPPETVQNDFSRTVGPMRELGEVLARSNVGLAMLRDLLLPKLVSGEIDVSSLDLDGIVDEAVV